MKKKEHYFSKLLLVFFFLMFPLFLIYKGENLTYSLSSKNTGNEELAEDGDTRTKAAIYKDDILVKRNLDVFLNEPINLLDAILSNTTIGNNGLKEIIIKTNINTNTKGRKEGVLSFVFDDDSVLDINIIVKVYEKVYKNGILVVNPSEKEYIEGKDGIRLNITPIHFIYEESSINPINDITYVKEFRDSIISDTISFNTEIKGLEVEDDVVRGVPIINWGKEEEYREVTVTREIKFSHLESIKKTSILKIYRDTDLDGLPDYLDEDDDGDGFSDELEKDAESDPKDKNSIPSMAFLDHTNVKTKTLEAFIGEGKIDLSKGIISKHEATISVIRDIDYDIKGNQVAILRLSYSDNSYNDISIKVKVYEVMYHKSEDYIYQGDDQTYIESNINNIKPIIIDRHKPSIKRDEVNFIDHRLDKIIKSSFIGEKYTLKENNDGTILSDNFILPDWIEMEEERYVYFNHVTEYEHLNKDTATVKIKVLRDTDKDGVPDITDEDDDGDGISDEIEIKYESNPKDASSVPSDSDLISEEVKTRELKRYIGEDSKLEDGVYYHPSIIRKEVINDVSTLAVGSKTGKVRVYFKDNSQRDFEIKVKVWKIEYIIPDFEVVNNSQVVIEPNKIKEVFIREKSTNLNPPNEVTFVEEKLASIKEVTYGSHSGLINLNNRLNGNINYEFKNNDEEYTLIIPIEIKYSETNDTRTSEVNILYRRDTDRDGIPDVADEDDDGDGVPDEIEIRMGTDFKDPSSYPRLADYKDSEVIIQPLNTFVNELVDINKAFLSIPKEAVISEVTKLDNSTKGVKNATLRLTYPDKSYKDYNVTMYVYNKTYLINDVSINNLNEDVVEGKEIKPISVNKKLTEDAGINHETFEEKIIDNLKTSYFRNYYSLKSENDKLSGSLSLNDWTHEEKERSVKISYVEIYENSGIKTYDTSIKVLRDRDKDGVPDTIDDDIDGDGFSNDLETKLGYDPLDPSSHPSEKDLDHSEIEIKTLDAHLGDKVDLRKAVKNIPSGTVLSITKNINTNTKGRKEGEVKLTFSDNSFKTFKVPVKVYEYKYHPKDRKVINSNTSIIENNSITNIIFKEERYSNNRDEANFIDNIEDVIISETFIYEPSNLLINRKGNILSGIPSVTWKHSEQEKEIRVSKKIVYEHLGEDVLSTGFKLLRDRDKDGIPDITDDDIDGDGFNNDLELKLGYDPLDPSSHPTLAETDETEIKTKAIKTLVNNSYNINDAFINLPKDTRIKEIEKANTSTKGSKTSKVNIIYKDNSFKTINVEVRVYEERLVLPEVKVNNLNTKNVIEGQDITPITFSITYPALKINEESFTKDVKAVEQTNVLDKNYNLNLKDNISGSILINDWQVKEQSRVIKINNIRTYNNGEIITNTITFTVDRDTDKDGIPDKDTDDADGDGFSDELEISLGYDPHDPNSHPTLAEVDKREIKTSTLEIEVNDKVDIRKAILNKPSGTNLVVYKDIDNKTKGKKEGIVKVVYSDNSFKEIKVNVNVYEVIYLQDKVTLSLPKQTVIEGKSIKPFKYIVTRENERIDKVNLIKYKVNSLKTTSFNNLYGLNNNSYEVSGNINYLFTSRNMTKDLNIDLNITYLNGNKETIIHTITYLRDTDKDGTPDINDNDIDGDGFSNKDEEEAGSDPFDPSSTPKTIIDDLLNNKIKELEDLLKREKSDKKENKKSFEVKKYKEFLDEEEIKFNKLKEDAKHTNTLVGKKEIINELNKIINEIKERLNSLSDKANITSLEEEVNKKELDIYEEESLKKIINAKNIGKEALTRKDNISQEEVDLLTNHIISERDKALIRKDIINKLISDITKASDEKICNKEELSNLLNKLAGDINYKKYIEIKSSFDNISKNCKEIDNPATGVPKYIYSLATLTIFSIIIYNYIKIKRKYDRKGI